MLTSRDVAVVFNLPGVSSLTLTRSQLVGIFNGTHTMWNDTTFAALNPKAKFPNAKIKVMARSDYSGTTEIFTRALSAFDPAWAKFPGTFAEGLPPHGVNHSRWNMSVVKTYGHTSRGVVGILFSLRYSLGYVSIAEVNRANVTYALLVNQAGNAVGINSSVTKAVIQENCPKLDGNLTLSLVDSPLPFAYPIIGFSYFLIRTRGMLNCDSAVELVRYLEWLYTDNLAYKDALQSGMTQLPSCVGELVADLAIKTMLCGLDDEHVYSLVEKQKDQEEVTSVPWQLPVYIIVPIATGLLLVLIAYATYQQAMLNRAIMADDWKIPANELEICKDPAKPAVGSVFSLGIALMEPSGASSSSMVSNSPGHHQRRVTTSSHLTAKWHQRRVSLKKVNVGSDQWKSVAKLLINFKYKITDANVMRFYGIAIIGDISYVVAEHSSKGSLRDVLQCTKYTIDDNFKYAMAWDVCSGLDYLHRNNIVHGKLSSENCLLDSNWTIKLADWESHQLKKLENRRPSRLSVAGKKMHKLTDVLGENPESDLRAKLWLAPELLRDPSMEPTKSSDVYSFSLVLVEIFTREDIFSEYTSTSHLEPQDIIDKLKASHFRPDVKGVIPDKAWVIAKKCWHAEAEIRPDIAYVVRAVQKARGSKRTVLEHMLQTMENYAEQLEEKVQERTTELTTVNSNLQNLLHQMLPGSVADRLQRGQKVLPESFESVTVYFAHLVNFVDLCRVIQPLQVVSYLNKVYTAFDHVVDKMDVYKVETIADSYMCISGLPVRNGLKHARNIAELAMALSDVVKQTQMPDHKVLLSAGVSTAFT